MNEIERRFLPRITIPEIPLIQRKNPVKHLKQAYRVNTPDYSQRVRSVENENGIKYFLTTKIGKGLSRIEHEREITEPTFDALAPVGNIWIDKLRYTFMYVSEGAKDIECTMDSFQNKELENLFLIEVEFKTIEEAKDFDPPYWFGEEVTYDEKYINANLIKKLSDNEK